MFSQKPAVHDFVTNRITRATAGSILAMFATLSIIQVVLPDGENVEGIVVSGNWAILEGAITLGILTTAILLFLLWVTSSKRGRYTAAIATPLIAILLLFTPVLITRYDTVAMLLTHPGVPLRVPLFVLGLGYILFLPATVAASLAYKTGGMTHV